MVFVLFRLCPWCLGRRFRKVQTGETTAQMQCPQCGGKGHLSQEDQAKLARALGEGL